MKSYILILSLTFFPFFVWAQDIGLPFSRYYSSQDYKGGIQNFAFSQSNDGLIYVANNFGLLEYDGLTWRRYSIPNSSKIRYVQADTEGKIFLTGQGDFGYFEANDQGILSFFSLKNKIPDEFQNLEEVWRVFVLSDQIVFCTFQHLFIFDKNLNYLSSIASQSTFESFHQVNNSILIQELGKGLHTLRGLQLFPLFSEELLSKNLITGITQIANENWLIFTRDEGISLITGKQRKKIDLNIIGINSVLPLKNGNIAISTQGDGIFIIQETGQILLHFDKERGLNNNTVLSLFEDMSGNLWLGHNNGISIIHINTPFRLINQFSGISGTGYTAHIIGDKLYFGTNNGLFVKNLQESPNDVQLVENSSGQVYQVKTINNLTLMGHNSGAFVIRDRMAEKMEGPMGIWNFQLLRGHENLILAGSYNGLHLFEILPNSIRYLRKIKGFNESSRVIEQDDAGNIWIAHGYKGIYRLQLNDAQTEAEISFYGQNEGLPTFSFNNVWNINNQLIFTTEAGIFSYDPSKDKFVRDNKWINYFQPDVLIHYLAEDPIGNIYFIASNEIGILEKKVSGGFEKQTQIFNQLIPLLNDDLQNISAIKSNDILFSANEGFINFRNGASIVKKPIFPTLIRAVYLTGSTDSLLFHGKYQNHNSQISIKEKIAYKDANIRFEASNPTPNNEQELYFQFWLEGFDKSYSEWTNKNDKAYTNLKEGKYTLRVKSRNMEGQVSPEATFSFTIAPPWYRSNFAYTIYLFSIMIIGFWLFKFIDKQFEKKTLQIKSDSNKAIKQKESELKLSQDELEKLKSEKLKTEIKAKDKELAAATMHLITKNSFIDHTKTHLNAIIKKSKNQEVKQEIQKVIKNIEKNIAEDEDWEQFEIHFDQVHGDFMNRFKKDHHQLSPQEIKLTAYLRMNLSTKEIAYLMNISIRGVEIARYRLRKKLGLDRSENLQEFILKF